MAARWMTLCSFSLCLGLGACDSGGGDGDGDADGSGTSGGSGEAGETGEPDPDTPTGAICPPGEETTITYTNFAADFFKFNCTTCHSASLVGDERFDAPETHNYDTRMDIMTHGRDIDIWAGAYETQNNDYMPPPDADLDSFPTRREREQLSQWIACGYPE